MSNLTDLINQVNQIAANNQALAKAIGELPQPQQPDAIWNNPPTRIRAANETRPTVQTEADFLQAIYASTATANTAAHAEAKAAANGRIAPANDSLRS